MRLRVGAVLTALALVFTMFVLVQQRAEAAPVASSVAASVASIPGDSVSAQTNFGQIFCAILLAIRNAFAGSPFFSFIQPVIDSLLAQFGCVPSG